jgi:2-polyprenyl-3-methyl-5-hydroxy-6-metoxy-1,4-benzoquinol methylase
MVRDLRRSPILDVGSAQGMLGHQLMGSGLVLDAVEPNPQWAELARPAYRDVVNSTIEQAIDRLGDRAYQVMVCADVLEHVPDPVGVLRRLRNLAAPDALFIISLPNIAHIAVRLMLLAGKFGPMQRGPLDKTHLHFYTRDSAVTMLEQAGLFIERVSATGVPLDEVFASRDRSAFYAPAMRLQHGLVRMLPRLFGFQWIFVAHRRPDRA